MLQLCLEGSVKAPWPAQKALGAAFAGDREGGQQ